MNIKCNAVIVAGGNGSRMNTKEKKQFLMLNNMPILIHTVKNISKSKYIDNIVVVVPEDRIADTEEMIAKYKCEKAKKVVKGGKTRPGSVKCGIDAVGDCDVIMIHDGVRPFIRKELSDKCIEDAFIYGGAVLGIPVKDTIVAQSRNRSISKALDRNTLVSIQTPQCFKADIIKKAYESYDVNLTDDASQVIKNGGMVHISEGDFMNIKITTPEDLISAEKYIEKFK